MIFRALIFALLSTSIIVTMVVIIQNFRRTRTMSTKTLIVSAALALSEAASSSIGWSALDKMHVPVIDTGVFTMISTVIFTIVGTVLLLRMTFAIIRDVEYSAHTSH